MSRRSVGGGGVGRGGGGRGGADHRSRKAFYGDGGFSQDPAFRDFEEEGTQNTSSLFPGQPNNPPSLLSITTKPSTDLSQVANQNKPMENIQAKLTDGGEPALDEIDIRSMLPMEFSSEPQDKKQIRMQFAEKNQSRQYQLTKRKFLDDNDGDGDGNDTFGNNTSLSTEGRIKKSRFTGTGRGEAFGRGGSSFGRGRSGGFGRGGSMPVRGRGVLRGRGRGGVGNFIHGGFMGGDIGHGGATGSAVKVDESNVQKSFMSESQSKEGLIGSDAGGEDNTMTDDGPTDIKDLDYVKINNDNSVTCQICMVSCTSELTFRNHVDGRRHQKNFESYGRGVSSIKNIRGSKKRLLRIQPQLDKIQAPLIGVEFVTEYHKEEPNVEERYICELCNSKADPRNIINHLIGMKHRVNYLKLYYPEKAQECYSTNKRSEQSELAQRHATDIENTEGRQVMKVKVELNPFYNANMDAEVKALKIKLERQLMAARRAETAAQTARRSHESIVSVGNRLTDLRSLCKHLTDMSPNNIIVTEDDASIALQVSNILTQALLTFRLGGVSSSDKSTTKKSNAYGENTHGYGTGPTLYGAATDYNIPHHSMAAASQYADNLSNMFHTNSYGSYDPYNYQGYYSSTADGSQYNPQSYYSSHYPTPHLK